MGGRYDVIVIGAGPNGLTTGTLLAKQGRKVLVLERADQPGGLAAGDVFHPGYRSVGLLHDTSGVAPAVADTLNLQRHGLTFGPAPISFLVPERDGPGLYLHHDPEKARPEIAAHSARDADRYRDYRRFLDSVRGVLRKVLVDPPPDIDAGDVASLVGLVSSGLAFRRLGRSTMREVLRIAPMSVADWLSEWFERGIVRAGLAAPAVYGNFSGPRSPATNAALLRSEMLAGPSVLGGAATLVAALAAAAQASGVDIRTGVEVTGIRVSNGQVEGVTISDGSGESSGDESLDATTVAASCDPRQTFLRLLSSRDVPAILEHRLETYRVDGVTAKVNLALDGPLRFQGRPDVDVEFARIGNTLTGMEQAFDALKYGRFSETPLLDIHVPTIENPAFAPDGHSVVSLVVHFAPHALREGWSDTTRDRLQDTVLRTLEAYAPGVRERMVAAETLTPVDIEARYGTTRGHIHHGEQALDQMIARPAPECARYVTPIGGLTLCGSGSHPGGGLTLLPGALAAGVIAKAT
jgi:phytoene dehydrogenase-like protein